MPRFDVKILVACESSGTVRRSFRDRGFDAWSCDLLPSDDDSRYHICDDVLKIIHDTWDLVIAHPPCTYLCSSGLHWNKRRPKRAESTRQAIDFFLEFTKLKCRWAIENPIGCMSSAYRRPDQVIQPYQFGHDASKSTCLWLNNLPVLLPTKHVKPRIVNGKPRFSNQTDSGQNALPPSKERWKIRSKTYEGIAKAMAKQWGDAVLVRYRAPVELPLPWCSGVTS